ncbi:MAG: DUF4097 domain-containing protein [Oscillospiraceae bacterium]|nr:DUF4097 domain-containing protein [Oscillospiraceae bacterium]
MVRVLTIICWVVTAIVLLGLAIWFFTGRGFGIGAGRLFSGVEALTGPFEIVGDYNISANNIDSLYIDWVEGSVTVIPYNGSDIRITESARRELRDDEVLAYSTSGSLLTIKFSIRNNWVGFHPAKQLDIYVPRELCENFESFTIDSASGGVKADNVNAQSFKIDSVSGKIDLTGITAKTFKAESTSGAITMVAVNVDSMTVDSVSGTVNVNDSGAGTFKCGTTSGAINISGDFASVDVDSISGKITLYNSALTSGLTAGSTSGSIDATGSFGTVKLNSVSGSLTMISYIVPSSLKAETTAGSITVTVPDGETVTVSHSSVSGKLNSEIPIITQSRNAQFNFSTVSGGVKILPLQQ